MCEEKGKFIYEVSPIFGKVFTVEEMDYWSAFNCIQIAKLYDVDIDSLDYLSARSAIDRKIENKKAEIANVGKRNIRQIKT